MDLVLPCCALKTLKPGLYKVQDMYIRPVPSLGQERGDSGVVLTGRVSSGVVVVFVKVVVIGVVVVLGFCCSCFGCGWVMCDL